MEDNVLKVKLKDTHYLASWDKKDLPLIRKWQEKIRNGERSKELGDMFFKLLDSRYNDHKTTPEPKQVAIDKKYILTWKGIAKMCRNITGQDTTTFASGGVAVGTGETIPQPYDERLVEEEEYIDFATNGFFDSAGVSIRYCGTFGETIPDDNFKESLVRNQATATGSIVLCRNIFANNPIAHDEGDSGFSAAGIIEFVPVVD